MLPEADLNTALELIVSTDTYSTINTIIMTIVFFPALSVFASAGSLPVLINVLFAFLCAQMRHCAL